MIEYPKWLPAPKGHPGHVSNPGFVLVENEDQEREAVAGHAPEALNPLAEPARELTPDIPIADMTRDQLINALVRESITDEVTDDELRGGLTALRNRGADNEHDAGEPLTDSAGEEVPAPVNQEANKGADLGPDGRTLPEAKAATATDARPDDAKAKEPDSKPAGNITEQAKTPPEHKKGAAKH